jgi:hypothetical protein
VTKSTSARCDVEWRQKKLGHSYCTIMKGRREINRNMSG